MSLFRTRWAAVGAAVAVTLGAGGIGLVSATSPTGASTFVPLDAHPVEPQTPGPSPSSTSVNRSTPLGEAETHDINANDGRCAGRIPAAATGLQLNVTALNATINTFLTIWPSGVRPDASSLNPAPGQPAIPNAVTTGITGAGNFNVYNNKGTVNVIVDIVGYYTDHNHDDRYYTKAQVDALIAGAPSPPPGGGGDFSVLITGYSPGFSITTVIGTITNNTSAEQDVRVDVKCPGGTAEIDYAFDIQPGQTLGWSVLCDGVFTSGATTTWVLI